MHFEVQDLPFWKQSQYFLVQLEFLQLHVQLFFTEFIWYMALGFRDNIFLYLSCLKFSYCFIFLQLQQKQFSQYLPFEKHSQ